MLSPAKNNLIVMKSMLRNLLVMLFRQFDAVDIEYCVIGNYHGLPEYTSNDVDIWVDDCEAAELILLDAAKNIGLKLYLQNRTANGSNNYFYSDHNKSEIEIVKIDLMRETSYRSIVPIVTADLIKRNRETYKDFKVANDLIEGVMHLLYPLITFGVIRDKYKEKIYRLVDVDEFRECLKKIVGQKHLIRLEEYIRDKNWRKIEEMSPAIKRYLIIKMFLNIDMLRLWIFLNFIKSIYSRIRHRNGIVVSFTGIDGAGKTSIKEYLVENSNKYFTKNRCKDFYWRPFLLPRIAHIMRSGGQAEIIDDSGKRVVASSLFSHVKNIIKYIYYSMDFIFGKIKYLKQSHTGGIVIFDRYHFDNIIYPERFGFKLGKGVMRFFDKNIIPQPDVLFYFTADTNILFDRKHEIDIDEINNQKLLYANEINKRNDIVEIHTDGSFDSSVRAVLLECLKVMSQRYSDHG